ncbi:MAG: 50S ribosomal protein L29 [Deltaproteobacteria bacterium]|nr:50S ribosomal protein L29 [Deltaproteobacteria bacterium]
MKIQEMRGLSADELEARIKEWQEELFRARCEQTIGQLGNTDKLRGLRRIIARAHTIINELRSSEKSANA